MAKRAAARKAPAKKVAPVEGHVPDDADRASADQPNKAGPQVVVIPPEVIELLQAEIEMRNVAMQRWTRKLAVAATLCGVSADSEYRFDVQPDGAAVFVVAPKKEAP